MLLFRFDEELGRTRVFLRATRDIANGEEIFVPYDKTYWQDNFEEQVSTPTSIAAAAFAAALAAAAAAAATGPAPSSNSDRQRRLLHH